MKRASWSPCMSWDCPHCRKENIQYGSDGYGIAGEEVKCQHCGKTSKLKKTEG